MHLVDGNLSSQQRIKAKEKSEILRKINSFRK